jgi:TldD protein
MNQQQHLKIAQTHLLDAHNLDLHHLDKLLSQLMHKGANYADLYFQHTENEAWVLDEGIIKSGSYAIDKGVGVRSVYHDKTAFAYTDQIHINTLNQAVLNNLSIGDSNAAANYVHHKNLEQYIEQTPQHNLYAPCNPLISLSSDKKIELLQFINNSVHKNAYVKNVVASISSEYDIVLIARADGKIMSDIRPLVRLSITIMVEKNGKHEKGHSGGGGRYDYSYFSEELIETYIQDALNIAYNNLEAEVAPAGTMPVVLGNGWPGVLLHEAIGHGLEGDFNRKGSSAFSQKIGQQVAAKGVTIVDDGSIANKRGSLNIDDEGNATQCNVLIENGILRNYMQDEMNARLMNMPVTGNGRRESYASVPMPRMTNTHMLSGIHSPEEIIQSVKHGIYATHFEGGQVDITNGKFVFTASQAFLIENGKITRPLKGATLIGDGPESLKHVGMIGNDSKLDAGVGVCGKSGQSVPVGVGQPTLLINEMTVGGGV